VYILIDRGPTTTSTTTSVNEDFRYRDLLISFLLRLLFLRLYRETQEVPVILFQPYISCLSSDPITALREDDFLPSRWTPSLLIFHPFSTHTIPVPENCVQVDRRADAFPVASPTKGGHGMPPAQAAIYRGFMVGRCYCD